MGVCPGGIFWGENVFRECPGVTSREKRLGEFSGAFLEGLVRGNFLGGEFLQGETSEEEMS